MDDFVLPSVTLKQSSTTSSFFKEQISSNLIPESVSYTHLTLPTIYSV